MPVKVVRKEKIFQPDSSRVIARFLFAGEERAKRVIQAVLALSDMQQQETLNQVLLRYAKRHRSIRKIFTTHFRHVAPIVERLEISPSRLQDFTRLLIGSYFTMEYSIEAAAFFNPSI